MTDDALSLIHQCPGCFTSQSVWEDPNGWECDCGERLVCIDLRSDAREANLREELSFLCSQLAEIAHECHVGEANAAERRALHALASTDKPRRKSVREWAAEHGIPVTEHELPLDVAGVPPFADDIASTEEPT